MCTACKNILYSFNVYGMTQSVSPPYVALGQAIASGRLAAGFEKQADLALRLSVSQQSVSRWEAGTHRPKQAQISEIASVLSLVADDMMTLAGYTIEAYTATRVEPLPVDRLDPETFELFCADLIKMVGGNGITVRRLGSQGHDQDGLDIISTTSEGKVAGFQCKRASQFGPTDVRNVVRAVSRECDTYTLILSRVVSPQAADAIKEFPRWEIWDKDDLSRIFRTELNNDQKGRLVDIYFKGQRRALAGLDEAGPWLTAEEFFLPFEGRDKPFTHGWGLVARTNEVKAVVDFARSAQPVLFLSAAGGMGKSKLLRDACEALATAAPGCTLRFLSPAAEADRKSLQDLGPGAKLLVIDDAHDRDKFGELLQFVANTANLTKIILATRPYAVARLKNQAATYGFIDVQHLTLAPLTKDDLEHLAGQVLPSKISNPETRRQLVEFSGQSPLVVAMAARVLATERLPFESIKDQNVFKTVILSRFAKVIIGDLGVAGAERLHRDVLEVLALVQPFHIDDPQLHQMLYELGGVKGEDAAAVLRRFLEGGVIFKRGANYRLMPDVLGDYVLDEACLDASGRLSPYARKAIEFVPDKLVTNLLVNLGRTDWRRNDGNTEGSDLLAHIWRSFDEIETEWDARLDAIKSVAVYQPMQALEFVRRQVRRGQAFGCLPDILRGIAYSGVAFNEVLEVLWTLGRNDESQTNSNTSHPIRVITDLAGYDLRKPLFFSEGVLDYALSLCDKPEAWTYKATPLDLLKPLMSLEGLHHTSNRLSFSVSPFFVDYDVVKPYRARIVDKMLELLTQPSVRIAYEAASFLEVATRAPVGLMGQSGNDDQAEAYYAEFVNTLGRVRAALISGIHPIAAVQVVLKIAWYATRHRRDMGKAARAVLKAAPNDIGYVIRELAFGNVWDRFIEDDSEERVKRFIQERGAKIVTAYPSVADRLHAIEAALDELAEARANAQTHFIIHQMCRDDPAFSEALCDIALRQPDRRIAQHVHSALGLLVYADADRGRYWCGRFLTTGIKPLLFAVASAYTHREGTPTPDDIAVLQELLRHADPDVSGAAIEAVAYWRDMPATQRLSLLVEANFGGRSKSADSAALALVGPRRDKELQTLPVEQIVRFVGKLEDIKELKGHWIDKLLSALSFAFPFETLQFFMRRVERSVADEGVRFRVANYGPWRHELLNFLGSPEYPEVARTLWRWLSARAGDRKFEYAAADFFEAALGHDNAAVAEFFTRWLDTATPEELSLMATLLRQAKPDFVFEQSGFVTRLLDHCRDAGTKVWERALSYLSSAAVSGMRQGTPGEPMPRDISDLERSIEMLNRISKLSPAFELYDTIRRHAEANIRHSRAEAEAWEDD